MMYPRFYGNKAHSPFVGSSDWNIELPTHFEGDVLMSGLNNDLHKHVSELSRVMEQFGKRGHHRKCHR